MRGAARRGARRARRRRRRARLRRRRGGSRPRAVRALPCSRRTMSSTITPRRTMSSSASDSSAEPWKKRTRPSGPIYRGRARAPPTPSGHSCGTDRLVVGAARRERVADDPRAEHVVDEVLGDAEPRVEDDVALEVFVAAAANEHLEREVDAALLLGDDPFVARVRIDVEHRDEVRREDGLAGVVDRELRREVHAALETAVVLAHRLERALFGDAVDVPFGRRGRGETPTRRTSRPAAADALPSSVIASHCSRVGARRSAGSRA